MTGSGVNAPGDAFVLSVIVWYCAAAARPTLPRSLSTSLPSLDRVRAVVFYCADAEDAELSEKLTSGFKALAMRAAAQQVYLVPYAAEANGTSVLTSRDDLIAAFGHLLEESSLPKLWTDTTLSSPSASIVVLPGSLPHVRCAVTVLLNYGGVLSLHELSVVYGIVPSPAKIFAYVSERSNFIHHCVFQIIR